MTVNDAGSTPPGAAHERTQQGAANPASAEGLTDERAHRARELLRNALDEVLRCYVGPREIPELILTALVARGHALLEGVPGVAKTTLIKAVAHAIGGSFKRIQFTPDLLPSDITGTYVLSPRDGAFQLRHGPIFAHVVLGDEINRAPAKTPVSYTHLTLPTSDLV